MDTPPISVVVIGRNEGEQLVRCLESVRAADYPRDRIEIVYVDTASTDGSADRAAPLADRVVRIDPQRPCAAAGRNAGWSVARHDLVQFLDGDTILHPSWLQTAATAMTDANVVCVFGRRAEAEPQRSVLRYWTHRDWRIPAGPGQACGGDVMFRRSILAKFNGYDETLIAGEEPDLCFRIMRTTGGTLLSLEVPMTTHDIGDFGFRQYWRRCVRTGHAYAEVARRHAGSGRRFWLRENLRLVSWFVVLAAAGVASAVWWSPWPLLIWVLLPVAQYGRYVASELRSGNGVKWSFLGALRYLACKPPQFLGQALFVFRLLTGRGRGRLIEYKAPLAESDSG